VAGRVRVRPISYGYGCGKSEVLVAEERREETERRTAKGVSGSGHATGLPWKQGMGAENLGTNRRRGGDRSDAAPSQGEWPWASTQVGGVRWQRLKRCPM
jgi:hypothetical protein